jgi:hypothetical protein
MMADPILYPRGNQEATGVVEIVSLDNKVAPYINNG